MKKTWYLVFICLFVSVLAGCEKTDWETEDEDFNYVCYLNEEESKIVQEKYEVTAAGADQKVEELYNKISDVPADSDYVSLLPEDVELKGWILEESVLWLDFSKEYAQMKSPREVLARAGIVRTFTQIAQIHYVGFKIEGKQLVDSKSQPVGVMSGSSFVENSGKQVNAYQYATLNLYFGNKTGDQLVKEERRIYYSKNTPLERIIVEQVIAGPKEGSNQATISTETKILGVTAVDGIGYVNLDAAFLNITLPVQGDVVIQSIVRSLTESSQVDKVQISVNGDTKVEFRESISLDQFFEAQDVIYREETGE